MQDVFIAAYENRAAFSGENLSAWLYRITYNRSINQAKKRKWLLLGEIPEKAAEPNSCAGFSDDTLEALRRLKPEERALIHARAMDEKSYDEIAEQFGCSPQTLRKRYERVKVKLAGYLTKKQEKTNRKEFGYEQNR